VEIKDAGRRKPRTVWVKKTDEYLPRFSWVNNSRLAVQFLNRAQTELQLVFADAADGVTSTVRAGSHVDQRNERSQISR
jgi:hypothetical protein